MTQYQCIIFDWDGTLMDSAQKIATCLQSSASDVGLPVPSLQSAKNIIGLGLEDSMRTVFGDLPPEKIQELIGRYRHHFLYENQVPQPMFQGVKQGLQRLQQTGVFLCVATGKARRGLDRVLTQEVMHDYFVYTRCADEARTKPHPQMLLDILEHLAIDKHKMLMVGDTSYDMEMAGGASIDAVALGHGVHSRQRLLDSGAQSVFNDFAELVEWLEPRVETAYQ